uniref:Uncharacterized protein n=1 Tax=Panagrolaimus davidi TaxID=227884 RepID=A0A914P6F4_9BILA
MEWLLLDFYRKEAKYGHIQEYPIADDDNLLFCNGPEPFENKTFYEAAKAMYYKDPVIQAQTSALTNPFSNQSCINLSLFGIFIFAVILLFILILLILCFRRMRRQKRVEKCVDEFVKLYFEA